MPLPTYNETDLSTLKPGMYLGLFHGRASPDEDLHDWGVNGPIIGPLEYLHVTYLCDLQLCLSPGAPLLRDDELCIELDVDRRDRTLLLKVEQDVVKCLGKFYGDWTVFPVGLPETPERRSGTSNGGRLS